MSSECEVCGGNLMWGGTSGFIPHTNQRHEYDRHRLLRYVKFLMAAKVAIRAGHRVTIRFTQYSAWSECSCGWHSQVAPDSSFSRTSGHWHLADVGNLLIRHTLLWR